MEHTTRRRPSIGRGFGQIAAVVVAAGALGLAVIAPAAAAGSSQTASEIGTAKNSKLGTILVAGDSAVYTLKAAKTSCDDACLKAFPPVVLPSGMTSATAGSGVDQSKLGTATTSTGELQVTYDGKPLYWYAKDKSATKAQNVSDKWGKWSAVVSKSSGSSGGSGGSGKTDAGSGGTAF